MPSGGLNFNYVTVEPKPEALDLSVSQVRERIQRRLDDQRIPMELYRFGLSRLASTRREIPFAVLYETAHIGSDLGIVKGAKTREQVLPLVQEALDTPYDENAYRQVAVNWAQVTRRTQARAGKLTRNPIDWNIHRQYEGHSQLIFRVRDQYGLDVEHCDITFKSNRQKQRTRLEKMIEDRHDNRLHPGTRTYYLRTQRFVEKNGDKQWIDLLDMAVPAHFEITGYEPNSDEIDYLPMTIDVPPALLRDLIQPFRTTVLDVTLLRLPSEKVFSLQASADGSTPVGG